MDDFRRLSDYQQTNLLCLPSTNGHRLGIKSSSVEVPRGTIVEDEAYSDILFMKLRERSKSVNSNLYSTENKRSSNSIRVSPRQRRRRLHLLSGSRILVWFPNSVDYLQRISGGRRNALTLESPLPTNQSFQARLIHSKNFTHATLHEFAVHFVFLPRFKPLSVIKIN